jgi:hypothetical protein
MRGECCSQAVLRSLAVLAERVPTAFEPQADNVRAFVLQKVRGEASHAHRSGKGSP